jgi:NAD+ synthase
MEPQDAKRKIIRFIRAYFTKAEKRTAVVGLSGGLDSAVTLALCVEALGSRRAVAVLLPSASTPAQDMQDAEKLARKLGAVAVKFPIGPVLASFRWLGSDRIAIANLSARVRMAALYSIARRYNGLVVGTGDKSEFMLGYFTKYGDGGADLFPIGGLYKTEVKRLGELMGVPESITQKPPSPALWKGHTAEGELGFSYEAADEILRNIGKKAKRRALERKFGSRLVSSIAKRMEENRHKLLPAPVCKL